VIGRNAFVDTKVTMGDRVKVQNGALVYQGVTVEDGVFIGPGAILTNDRYPRAVTTTGDLATTEDWAISPIILRTGCSIGAGAVVVAGVTVGAYSTIGAGAVVTKDVLGQALVVGNPARRIGWVCECGMRLKTSSGRRADADPSDGEGLICTSCRQQYVFVADPEGLTASAVAAPGKREIPA
jgi:serine acetyltransferase